MLGISLITKIGPVALFDTLQAAGTTVLTSNAIDLANFDGCLFGIKFDAIVAGGLQSVVIHGSDLSGSGFGLAVDDEGNNVSVTVADTDDNKWVWIDCPRFRQRYAKVVINRSTQNATVAAVLALPYNFRSEPVSISSTYNVAQTRRTWPSAKYVA